MKQKRSKTLLFQLIVCFSAILIVIIALLAASWGNSHRENQISAKLRGFTAPYMKLYAGIDELSNSATAVDYSSKSSWEHENDAAAVREASQSLMQVLNEDGYNRTSIDLNNTIQSFLDTHSSIVHSYESHEYALAYSNTKRLQKIEGWIRNYLKQVDSDITEKQDALLLYSEQIRTRYHSMMFALGTAIFLMCVLVLVLTARCFVAPIQMLCKNVKEFRLTDDVEQLHARGIPCRQDSLQEIRTLATAIYSMQDTVLGQYAIEKNMEMLRIRLSEEALHAATAEKELQETRLKALQAQINPHFLFNTLNMIAQMSYLEGAERTTDLLETFCDYFRYNVKSFERNVTLAEELTNVRGYIALQRERLGERIAYCVEADEDVNDIQVPCLIIQPLVENAIVHGLRLKSEDGKVQVKVCSIGNGGFEISVADNGCGMDEESLNKMIRHVTQRDRDENTASGSIGISNVFRRLNIAFGDGVEFRASSAPGEGLCITLRVEGGSRL